MSLRRFPESAVFYRDLFRDFAEVVRGEGICLYDATGKRYIDASGGALVVNLGHGRREVAAAMAEQARRVAYAHGSMFTSRAIEDLSAALVDRLPAGLDKVYLVHGGTEASETAIKLARAYQTARGRPHRYRLVGLRPGYHGNTLGSLAASGRGPLRAPYEPLLAPFPLIPYPYCYRCPWHETYPACGVRCADELEALLKREGDDTVSAFIAEPVNGSSAGAAVPPPEYFPRIREICDRYGLLLILDEVLTGMGRTGRFLALEHFGVVPDMLLLGKGLSGGYAPAGALVTKTPIVEAVRDHFGNFIHGYTFSHHPVVAAACRETLQILRRERLVERAKELGAYLLDRLGGVSHCRFVGDVRGKGLLAGIELVADKATKTPFPRSRKLVEEVTRRAFEKGLLLYPSTGSADGTEGDVITLAPPFVIEASEIDDIVSLLGETFEEIEP